jgi:alpha-2-macroglobulin
MPLPRAVLVVVTSVSLVGCTCGKSSTDPMQAPGDRPQLKLDPLPMPPPMSVDPSGLSGSGQELKVAANRPVGDVFGEVRPTITFTRPIKSLEMVEAQRANDTPIATITPPLAGEWRWLGSASVEFVPKGLVPMSTEYTVKVTKGLKSLDGAALTDEVSFSFRTPVLELQDVAPDKGYRWLTPDQNISLLFNQPVKESDLASALVAQVEGEKSPVVMKVISRTSIQDERRAEIEKAKKDGKPYEPLDEETRGYRNQQTRYVVGFAKQLPLGKSVQVSFKPSLHGEQGPLTPASLETLSYRTYGAMRLESAKFCVGDYTCPYGPLVISTSNEADIATLKERLQVSPPVNLDWESAEAWAPRASWEFENRSPYMVVPGAFKPGVQYTVSVAAGTADVFKQADNAKFDTKVRTDDLRPSMVVGGFLGVVEASGPPRLPVEVANLKTLDVNMWKLTVAEVASLVAQPTYERKAFPRAADFSERLPLKYPRNVSRVHPLELKNVFGDSKTGLAFVTVDSNELPSGHQPEQQLVQVTDLAAHIKIGPKSSLVWVTRLSTGAPVDGADVTLHDQAGAQVWAGRTNGDGFADVPGTVALKLNNPEYRWEYPFALVVAQKEGDVAFTANTWASGVEPYEFGLSQGWEGEKPDSTGYAFTDRGIYKPGDEVFIKGVMRYRILGELRAPSAGSKAKLTVTDSRGEKVFDQTVTISKYGTFFAKATVPAESPTGFFDVSAVGEVSGEQVQARTGFRVEEYRAPQFRVDVETKKADVVAGEPLEATVSARYLFGGAMADAAAKWSVHRFATDFAPAEGAGFTFAQETWWWDDAQPESGSSLAASGDSLVDAQGTLKVSVAATEAPAERPYTYTAEAEVTDVNRQAVAGRVDVTVHPAKYYVGLRSPSYFLQVGTAVGLEALALDTTGKRVAGKPLEVTVTSRTWKSVKKKDATGGFSTLSEPVETQVQQCKVDSNEGVTPCSFTPASAGFFIIRARIKDESGRTHSSSMGLYATGSDWVAWQRNDTDRVELITDKKEYDVGDIARVLVKSPYPEAKAMVTVEREGVLERRLVSFKGSVNTIEVKITEEMVPNIFAGVVTMRPRVSQGGVETGDDPGRPNARIGLVKLSVKKKSKVLAVAVTTDKKDYQPKESVKVDIKLADSAGKPVDGEVTLYVVDEAVLRLTGYQMPDPVAAIHPERPLSMRLGEPLLHLVRRRNYGEKGEAQGGGGGDGEGAGIRSNFKTTVLFNPSVETSGGKANLSFTLPDNLTAFRVMAVVTTTTDRFGAGETSFQVNKPLMALPAMPRFARVGDTFEAGTVVHARGVGAGSVTVSATVEGAAALNGPAEQKVEVKETAPKEVRFAFKATGRGKATVRFKVSGNGQSDAVQEVIPVELPVELDTVATYGDTTDNRVEGIVPPKDVYDDLGGLQLTLASTSMGNFGSGFQQLIEYPYGCLEQQSSRLVPFVALREIAGQFGVPWPGADQKKQAKLAETSAWLSTYLFKSLDVTDQQNPDDVINSTTKSILALQDQSGAFRYWASAWCPNSWASTYATLALSRAKEVGFAVPSDRLDRARGYLEKVVGGNCSPCELSCPAETRAFASYVLARMRKPKASAYPDLLANRNQLSQFGKAVLANAMFVGNGNKEQAKALLQEVMNNAKESPKGVHIEEADAKTYATSFSSDTRTTGVVLQALTDIDPNHPYVSKMTQYVTGVRQGNGEWRSTQEAAFSLMALTQVLRTKERETPDFTAKVALGASSLVEQVFKGRSLEPKVQFIPMKELLAKASGAEQKLTVSKTGTGVIYYGARLSYATKQMPTKALDNGLFVQRWFEPYAGGGQSLKFFAGDLVRIRVRVASNQERHWVAFEVPLPAGLEPVDTSLSTTAKLTQGEESREVEYEAEGAEDGESGSADGYEDVWAGRFYSPFTHTELRDSKAIFFADHLPPGVHVTSFVARATTPGTYVLKPAKGTLMYEPEVWGRSEGGSFEVALPTSVTQK